MGCWKSYTLGSMTCSAILKEEFSLLNTIWFDGCSSSIKGAGAPVEVPGLRQKFSEFDCASYSFY